MRRFFAKLFCVQTDHILHENRNVQGSQSQTQTQQSGAAKPLGIHQQQALKYWAESLGSVATVVQRHASQTALELHNLEKTLPLNKKSYFNPSPVACYSCSQQFRRCHPVYLLCCRQCGDKFQRYRTLSRDLTGTVCVVVGARTKLGHQIALKLLSAGATVIATTRFPEKAVDLFCRYPSWKYWNTKLHFFSLDLDSPELAKKIVEFRTFISQHTDSIDVLVNCAAQTIRSREKNEHVSSETNRYGNDKHVPPGVLNSWNMRLPDVSQTELEEVCRINAIGPALLIQGLLPLLQASNGSPYVINVHAREGLFGVPKTDIHLHTNMSKAALAMLTKSLVGGKYNTNAGNRIWFHGIDPGWISIDEYHQNRCPLLFPPLDEIDGAARILYPVMARLQGSFQKTRRHFDTFIF